MVSLKAQLRRVGRLSAAHDLLAAPGAADRHGVEDREEDDEW